MKNNYRKLFSVDNYLKRKYNFGEKNRGNWLESTENSANTTNSTKEKGKTSADRWLLTPSSFYLFTSASVVCSADRIQNNEFSRFDLSTDGEPITIAARHLTGLANLTADQIWRARLRLRRGLDLSFRPPNPRQPLTQRQWDLLPPQCIAVPVLQNGQVTCLRRPRTCKDNSRIYPAFMWAHAISDRVWKSWWVKSETRRKISSSWPNLSSTEKKAWLVRLLTRGRNKKSPQM